MGLLNSFIDTFPETKRLAL